MGENYRVYEFSISGANEFKIIEITMRMSSGDMFLAQDNLSLISIERQTATHLTFVSVLVRPFG